MKRIFSIPVFCFILQQSVNAQPVCDSNTFQSVYWNAGVHDTYVTNMYVSPSFDVYMCGYTNSAVNKSVDAWIMETTARGNVLWSRAIGTAASETVNGIKRTSDNGFLIFGGTRVNSKYDEGWLTKTDPEGRVQWSVRLGASWSNIYQVVELADGGYAAAGGLFLDFDGDGAGNVTNIRKSTNIVLRLDKNGNTLWWKSFYQDYLQKLNTVSQLRDGNLLVAGNIFDQTNAYVIKMDLQNGNIIWMNGFEHAAVHRFSHATELPDGRIQLVTANKYYYFTADGKYLPGKSIILSSKGVDYVDAKPEQMTSISPSVDIYFANVSPKPVLFAVKNDSAIIWAHTFNQTSAKITSFHGGKILGKGIFMAGIYQTDNLSDGTKDEHLSYLIKADANGKTLCADTFDISMRTEPLPALPDISHDWVYEGSLNPQFMQVYLEEMQPMRSSDCFTQTCCKDTITQKEDFICEGSDYRLPDGQLVKDTGRYVAAFNTIRGCDSIIHTHLGFKKIFNFSLGSDTCLLNNSSVTFNVPADTSVRYRWQDGSGAYAYTANFPGQYWVTATSYCNIARDSVKVFDECRQPVYLPSGFTPNRDGLNDVFRIANINSQHLVNFNVYNRFGQLVFATDDPQKGWDGTFRNNPQPSGAYVYFVRYTDLQHDPHMLKGTVVLIR